MPNLFLNPTRSNLLYFVSMVMPKRGYVLPECPHRPVHHHYNKKRSEDQATANGNWSLAFWNPPQHVLKKKRTMRMDKSKLKELYFNNKKRWDYVSRCLLWFFVAFVQEAGDAPFRQNEGYLHGTPKLRWKYMSFDHKQVLMNMICPTKLSNKSIGYT